MSLTAIVQANEAYAQKIERSVDLALKDPAYQEELRQSWEAARKKIPVQMLPTGMTLPALALPHIDHPVQVARYLGEWGLPGEFPYGLAIYPQAFVVLEGQERHKEPTRIFAGLGSPEMTNERFHYILGKQSSKRLSTAFDHMTLIGRGADNPDYFFDIGEGGVSVSTYEDVKRLYAGFFEEEASISMTINGPSVWMTAARIAAAMERDQDLRAIQGTSQTDPCKEDDAQNELIFPLADSLRLAMDMFEWCVTHTPRYYPINVSGYHIEQKGATPIQQLAFTLANGFVYVDEARQRGIPINTIGKKLPVFFTSGTDLEYIALLSAARRLWAVALRDVYGADDPKAQKLKAHVQTSGRSLYEREILNNITRTALELFYALLNYPDSLHSNSYDEPITTPTEGAVRIAADAQSILLEEMGGFKDMMGFLSDGSGRTEVYRRLIQESLEYFRQIDALGGTLTAKTQGFFRDQIEQSSSLYEAQVRSGKRPIIGVNRYAEGREESTSILRVEIPEEVKRKRVQDVQAFKARRDPVKVAEQLRKLQEVASKRGNVFEVTLEVVKDVTLDEWAEALQTVYGLYRRKR